ncbi:MAG: potassium channel family protein [Fimbriimonadaceae bacterium]
MSSKQERIQDEPTNQLQQQLASNHFGIFLPLASFLARVLLLPAQLIFGSKPCNYDAPIDRLKSQFMKLDVYFIVSVLLAAIFGFTAHFWHFHEVTRVIIRIVVFLMIANAYAVPFVLGAFAPPTSHTHERAVLALKRVVIIGLQIYAQIILWFGVIYVSDPFAIVDRGEFVANYETAVYFSMITALTIGYGDVVPHGSFRLAAMLEGIACVALLTMLLTVTYSGIAAINAANRDISQGR